MTERTTFAGATEDRQQLEKLWEPSRAQWLEDEKLVWQEGEVWKPEEAVAHKTGTAAAKLSALVDDLVTIEPVIKRKPKKKGEEHEAKADRVEKWAEAVFKEIARREMMPPFKTMAYNAGLYGYFVGKAGWNQKAYEAGKFPFHLEAPHPARVLLPPMTKEPTMAVEVQSRFVYQVKEEYPKWETNLKDFDIVEVLLHWNQGYRSVFVDQQEVVLAKNAWGFVPYTQAYAGFGGERMVQPSQTGVYRGPRPEDLAVGLLRWSRDSIKGLDEWFTGLRHLMREAVDLRRYFEGDAVQLADAEAEAGVGGVVGGVPRGSLTWREMPDVSKWMFAIQERFQGDVDQSTFAGEVQGERTPGVTTAFQHALILGRAKLKFGVTMMQLNHVASLLLSQCARMVVAVNEPCTVGGITVRPDDFEEDYAFEVDFGQEDEIAKRQRGMWGLELAKVGKIDDETLLQEYVGLTDATGVKAKVRRQRLLESEQVQAFIIQQAIGIAQARRAAKAGATPGVVEPAPVQAVPGSSFVQPGSEEAMQQMAGQEGMMARGDMPPPPGMEAGGIAGG